MSSFKVAGIQHGTTKKGEPYHVLHLMQQFDKPEYGEGSRVSQEFIFSNSDVNLAGITPGALVNVSYSKGFDGKAYVSSVELVNPASRK